MTAPDKIFAWEYDGAKGAEGQWRGSKISAITGSTEYTRTDLAQAAVAAAYEAAARVCASHPDDYPHVQRGMDYSDGYMEGCRNAASAIRALATLQERMK